MCYYKEDKVLFIYYNISMEDPICICACVFTLHWCHVNMRLLDLGWASLDDPTCQERIWVLFISSLPFHHLYQIYSNRDVITWTSNKILKGGDCFYFDQLIERQSEAFKLEFCKESYWFKIWPTIEYTIMGRNLFLISGKLILFILQGWICFMAWWRSLPWKKSLL